MRVWDSCLRSPRAAVPCDGGCWWQRGMWWAERASKCWRIMCKVLAHHVETQFPHPSLVGLRSKLYDWRLPEVRDYFVNQVIAPYVDNANISGLFLDDTTDVATRCMVPPHGQTPCTGSWTFTAEEQLDFTNATMVHLDAALSSMQAHGKTAIVSTEVTATSTPLNSSTFDKMLMQHGAMHYNEFFEGSQSDIVSALGTTTAGGAFMVHALGSDDFAQREYPLAAFLIVAGEFSYWGMGNGWSIGSFPWCVRPSVLAVSQSHGLVLAADL